MNTENKIDKRVHFLGYDCEVILHEYPANKQIAIQLVIAKIDQNEDRSCDSGQPMCMATVCLPDHTFEKNETAIKNFSENEGIYDVLIDAKIIKSTDKYATNGFCTMPIVKIIL